MDEYGRLHDTAERLIRYLSDGDVESFRTLWNHLGFADQRVIAESLIREVAELRRLRDQGYTESLAPAQPSRGRVALRVLRSRRQ
jgi:hypothetical protein